MVSRYIVSKRNIYIFFIAFVLFAGTNCSGLIGIGIFVKIFSNIFFVLMSLDLLKWILRNRAFPKISLVTIIYIIYILLFIIVSIINGSEIIKLMLLSLAKNVVGFIWLDNEVRKNKKVLTGPIMYAIVVWCLLDSILTIIYPEGASFLNGGYILGWKNNKIMHLFLANLLLAFKFIKLKRASHPITLFWMRWFVFFTLCLINAYIIESSTTMMVISVLFIYLFASKIINRTLFVNGRFILLFHLCCFIILVFVRELFQQPLDDVMQLLFQKDATFTGRIYIWRAAILLILNSFLFGYGRYEVQQCILDGGWIYNWDMAHNQILECMMEGGLVLTSMWVFMVYRILMLNHYKRSEYSKLSLFAFFSFLFFFHMEASLTMVSFYIFYVFLALSEYNDEDLMGMVK